MANSSEYQFQGTIIITEAENERRKRSFVVMGLAELPNANADAMHAEDVVAANDITRFLGFTDYIATGDVRRTRNGIPGERHLIITMESVASRNLLLRRSHFLAENPGTENLRVEPAYTTEELIEIYGQQVGNQALRSETNQRPNDHNDERIQQNVTNFQRASEAYQNDIRGNANRSTQVNDEAVRTHWHLFDPHHNNAGRNREVGESNGNYHYNGFVSTRGRQDQTRFSGVNQNGEQNQNGDLYMNQQRGQHQFFNNRSAEWNQYVNHNPRGWHHHNRFPTNVQNHAHPEWTQNDASSSSRGGRGGQNRYPNNNGGNQNNAERTENAVQNSLDGTVFSIVGTVLNNLGQNQNAHQIQRGGGMDFYNARGHPDGGSRS